MKVTKTLNVEIPVEVEVDPVSVINDLAEEIHATAISNGFWDQDEHPFVIPTKLALISDEVSEALKVHREDYNAAPHSTPNECGYEDCDVCGGTVAYDGPLEMDELQVEEFGLELADVIIRTLDLAHHYSIPIGEQLVEKVETNRNRPYKHGKRY